MNRYGTGEFATGGEAIEKLNDPNTTLSFSGCPLENLTPSSAFGFTKIQNSDDHFPNQVPAVSPGSPKLHSAVKTGQHKSYICEFGGGIPALISPNHSKPNLHLNTDNQLHTVADASLPFVYKELSVGLLIDPKRKDCKLQSAPSNKVSGESKSFSGCDFRTNHIKNSGRYVYDGGGSNPDAHQSSPSENDSQDTVVSLCPINAKEAPNRPCNTNLLPRPEELIGPPANDNIVLTFRTLADGHGEQPSKSAYNSPPVLPRPTGIHGANATDGASVMHGVSASLRDTKIYGANSKHGANVTQGANVSFRNSIVHGANVINGVTTVGLLNISNSNRSKAKVRSEETLLLAAESSVDRDQILSSKKFIHASLSYKSKCRNYKLVCVCVCYLSLVLLALAVRQLRKLRLSDEQSEELDLSQEEEELDGLFSDEHYRSREKRSAGGGFTIRKVGNRTECVPVYNEDHNEIYIMGYDAFMSGGYVVHILIGMYTFCAIAAICDIYFVPALEHICEDLKLEADVAGATFMAAASSAPEFCTSVIGIFVQETDVGLGAIVGSSIFNLLAIVGLCAIFAGMPVRLSWYPLSRDSIFYTVAVFEMLAFMYDTLVYWYEALVMIMTYLLYILVMVYNKKIEDYVTSAAETAPASRTSSLLREIHRTHSARLEIIRARSHSRASIHHLHALNESRLRQLNEGGLPKDSPDNQVSGVSQVPVVTTPSASNLELSQSKHPLEVDDTDHQIKEDGGTPADPKRVAHVPEEPVISTNYTPPNTIVDEEGSESAVAEYENPLDFPKGWVHRVYWILVLPVTVLHAFTIPDSRIQNSWQSRFYMIPFILSVVYLAIYSYIMVWAMSVAAWGLSVPVTVTGLTILAAGTSVPDCLSSIFVARDGYGDMAVSNAIGSNVFDILLCLGVPWLVMGIIRNGYSINSEAMWVAGSTLLFTIVYLILSLRVSKWTLTPMYGLVTLLTYALVIVFCILVEMNIIFELHSVKPC